MSGAAAREADARDGPKQELLEAAFNGDWKTIEKLVHKGDAHIDSVDDDGFTALHIAAATGNHSLVVNLLEHGAKIDLPNGLGMTAFHHAAREGRLDIIDTLLQLGANTQLKTHLGVTALTLACAGGHGNVVRRLLSFRQDSNVVEQPKRSLAPTPLIVATYCKSPMICQYLVRQGAMVVDETVEVLKGLSAISFAILCIPGDYMVRSLLDLGGKTTNKGFKRFLPMELAKEMKRKDLEEFFNDKSNHSIRLEARMDARREIKKDLNIERYMGAPQQNGFTLLMYAITVRSINSARHLILNREEEVNLSDDKENTALQIASLLRVDDIIPLLLQRNSQVSAENKYGSTAYDLFLMSCDVIESGQNRALLHCFRPSDMKLNLSNSSSNLYKALGTKNLLNKVSSQILNTSKTEVIEPKQWLEARTKYQPAKMRNAHLFASVEDILKGKKIIKRPETNEYDNEIEAVREYLEDCQSFAVTCFTDFYGERAKPQSPTEYYDIAQFHAKRSGYQNEEVRKLPIVRPRRDSIERDVRKPRNISMVESPSQNQIRTTPRMLKKSRDTQDVFSVQAPRRPAVQVPTFSVAAKQRSFRANISEEIIWDQFVRRQQIPLMEMLKKEEIDRYSFFDLRQQHLVEMGIYSRENIRTIEEIQKFFLPWQ